MKGKTKGTLYVSLRKIVQAKGKEFEEKFIEQLDPVEKNRYLNAMNVSWIDLSQKVKEPIVSVAARMLFPGYPDAIQQVGLAFARENINGIYKIFFRIPSTGFIFKRVANIWSTYNDQGKATVEDWDGHRGKMVIRGFPDIEKTQVIFLEGYIQGVLEYTRAKNVKVKSDMSNPDEIKWHVQFEKEA